MAPQGLYIPGLASGGLTYIGNVAPAGFYNFTGSNLSKWSASRAAVVAGTRNAKVVDFGDSTVAGYGANGAPATNAVLSARMAALAPTIGVNASISSFFADHHIMQSASIPLATFDSRITTGGFSGFTNAYALGGELLYSSTATPLTFTPINQVDTFDIYYTVNPGLGSFSYTIDAGTPGVISQDGAKAVTKVTVSAALGHHTLKLAWVSGGTVFIIGAIGYNSAAKEVSLINAGYCSATSGWLVNDSTSPWDPLPTLSIIAPDLTIIQGGQVNDWNAGTAQATVTANLQAMITTAKLSGDVILISSNPSQVGAGPSYATQQGYVNAMKALAISNGVPFINVWELFVSWEVAQANGYNFDGLHPSTAGYAKIASYIKQALELT